MKLLDDSTQSGRTSTALVVGILVVLLAAGAAWWWLGRGAPAPEPPASTAPAPAAESRPTTGSIEVSSDRPGAMVFLDGERLGAAPTRAEGLAPGSHHVRVEASGRPAIEREVHVLPGRVSSVDASFGAAPTRLRITADVEGASVFLDREFVGRTPLSIEVSAGSHQLQVSAEGLDPHTDEIELAKGRTFERHVLLKRAPPLEASIEVQHKHGIGSCRGTLVADDSGLSYRTDHKDAFSVPLGGLEEFEFDYLDKNLKLKVRGGRKYNFRGDPDALLVFHREVAKRLPQ
jgi:hypothetical protein